MGETEARPRRQNDLAICDLSKLSHDVVEYSVPAWKCQGVVIDILDSGIVISIPGGTYTYASSAFRLAERPSWNLRYLGTVPCTLYSTVHYTFVEFKLTALRVTKEEWKKNPHIIAGIRW